MNLITDPVVCKQCFDSFDTHSNFIKNCLEKVKDLRAIKGHDSVIWGPSIDPCIKIEAIDIKLEENEPLNEFIRTESIIKVENKEILMKMEYSEIKLEDNDRYVI